MGFRAGLMGAGKSLFSREVGNFDYNLTKEPTRRMFADPNQRPDAVFAANDYMAFTVLEVLRYELGLRVPQDVSVVGYDDVPLAAWPFFDLTTVRQPVNLMVKEAVDTLLMNIEQNDTEPRRLSLDGPLVVRGSAKKPLETG